MILLLPSIQMKMQARSYLKSKCQGCHGPGGVPSAGMAKAMGLKELGSSDVQSMSDADLTSEINNGKGKMPAFKDKLSASQIKEVVAYIRTLKK